MNSWRMLSSFCPSTKNSRLLSFFRFVEPTERQVSLSLSCLISSPTDRPCHRYMQEYMRAVTGNSDSGGKYESPRSDCTHRKVRCQKPCRVLSRWEADRPHKIEPSQSATQRSEFCWCHTRTYMGGPYLE